MASPDAPELLREYAPGIFIDDSSKVISLIFTAVIILGCLAVLGLIGWIILWWKGRENVSGEPLLFPEFTISPRLGGEVSGGGFVGMSDAMARARAGEELSVAWFTAPDIRYYPKARGTAYSYNDDGGREFVENKPFLGSFNLATAIGAAATRLELTSNVVANSGKLTGTWSEATRNVSGDVEGSTSGGRFQVVVRAGTFSADLVLNTRGNSQSVVIRSAGGEFKGDDITLTRT